MAMCKLLLDLSNGQRTSWIVYCTHNKVLNVHHTELHAGMASGGTLLMAMSQILLDLPNSRRNETEADTLGVELLARACYNPEGLASALQVRKS